MRAEVEVRSSSGTSTPTTSYPAPPAHPHSTLKSRNVLVYRDDNHVTKDFARTLAPAVEAQLRQQGFEP